MTAAPAPASPRSGAPSIGPGGRPGSGGWACWWWPRWSPSSSCGSSAGSTGRRSDDALRHLTWWQPFVLLAVVVVRQVLNALPLALYIPGSRPFERPSTTWARSSMSAVAPPPSDLALRVGMFNSWGVPTVQAVAGTLMNTLTFYIVRFAAPLLGFVLLLAVDETCRHLRWLDLAFVAIAVAILVGVLLVVRSDQLATAVGSFSGRMARKVRRSVDPEAWVQGVRGLPRADLRPVPLRVRAVAARPVRHARRRPDGAGAVAPVRRASPPRRWPGATSRSPTCSPTRSPCSPSLGWGSWTRWCWPPWSRPAGSRSRRPPSPPWSCGGSSPWRCRS